MATSFKMRMAPTPSGFLHLGNCYGFVLTHLIAKKMSATLLLRIDDLDRARYRPRYVVNIFRTLELLGIEWDEGPQGVRDFEQHWSQQHRSPLYTAAIRALKENNQVYACGCSRSKYVHKGFNCCVRAPHKPKRPWHYRFPYFDEALWVRNIAGTRQQLYLPDNMQNFVVQRKNGFAAYQLSSLIDDVHFGCTHIVRGRDLFDSTLAQLALAKSLDFDFASSHFLHHKLLVHKGRKLSKAQAAPSAFERLKKPEGVARFYQNFSRWLELPVPLSTLEELEKEVSLTRLITPH